MSKQEVEAFQNWLWGRLHPQDFLIKWGPLGYKELGMLCGVTEITVQHWFSNPNASSHQQPLDKYQRILMVVDWLLTTCELTPEQLIAQFERDWLSRKSE